MKLILLGTGGFLPTDTVQTACYFLPEPGVMLDAGHGLYRLPKYLQTDSLDIYLTHAHADHTSGLDYVFASFVKWNMMRSQVTLTADSIDNFVQLGNESLHRTRIHADEATRKIVEERYRMFNYDWHTLKEQEALKDGGTLTHFLMETGSRGFRLSWPGHSLAYVTDTIARPNSAYIEKIANVDLLLHDCNGPDHHAALIEKIGHSHLSAVAQLAMQAQVKRLILIHSSPIEALDYSRDIENARKIFPSTEIAFDGMEVEF
jgi:ribonuclease BN (tRNA processing enzyme)